MKKSIAIFIALLTLQCQALSQVYTLSDLQVFHGENELTNPLAGGLRAPQFNMMDVNLDGEEDLIIFDREGDIIIPLISDGNDNYDYDPTYRTVFPAVRQWVRLVDYNGDGVKDLFCSPITIGIPGVEIYKGVITNGVLSFEQILFPQNSSNIIFYPLGSSRSQVYVSPADQPEIKDIDGDGDIDIIAFEPAGSSVFYYRNMTVEDDLDPDLFEMRLEDQCYGGFIESGFSQDVSLSPSPGDCANFFRDPSETKSRTRHAGSTVTAEDVTGDGLNEVLLGDIAYNGIVQLVNGGNENLAWMTDQELRFPQASDRPVDIELFLATFFEDVRGDSIQELIVSINDRTGVQGANHIWLYDRVKTEGQKDQFLLNNRNYLVDEMIYTGAISAPLFFDHNNDGLIDLLIGTSGKSPDGISIDPRMILYENQGSLTSPKYVLADNDYLDMAQFRSTSRHFAPAIGDLDGDGDQDMVIGDDTGRLYYISNGSNDPKIFAFRRPVYDPWDIRVSAWAKPAIYDYNNDGFGDLVLGEQNFNSANGERGSFNYFENQGTVGNPLFDADENKSPNQPIWGKAFMKEPGFISNFSAPAIVDLGDRQVLVAGTEKGSIYLYDSLMYGEDVTFELISNFLGEIREGQVSSISLADIDDDQLMELAVGTRRGGVGIFDTDLKIDINSPIKEVVNDAEILVSPVPATDEVTIILQDRVCDNCAVRLSDSSGRIIAVSYAQGKEISIGLAGIPDGIYIANIEGKDFIISSKIVKANP